MLEQHQMIGAQAADNPGDAIVLIQPLSQTGQLAQCGDARDGTRTPRVCQPQTWIEDVSISEHYIEVTEFERSANKYQRSAETGRPHSHYCEHLGIFRCGSAETIEGISQKPGLLQNRVVGDGTELGWMLDHGRLSQFLVFARRRPGPGAIAHIGAKEAKQRGIIRIAYE